MIDKFLAEVSWKSFPARPRATPGSHTERVRLAVEVLEARYAPANLLWIGQAGGLWSVAGNWAVQGGGNAAPVAGDNLTFDPNVSYGQGGANTSSTDDIQNLAISSITVGANYGATITLNNVLTVGKNATGGASNAASSMAGGSLAAPAPNPITGGGGPTGGLELFSGTFTWSGGSWRNSSTPGAAGPTATIDPNATLNISNPTALDEFSLSDAGIINLSGNLQVPLLWNLTTLAAQPGGQAGAFNITADVGISPELAQGFPFFSVTNNGTFTKSGGTGLSAIGSPGSFTNAGTLNVQTGTLQFPGTATQTTTGTTTIFNNATLGVSGTYTVNGGILAGAAGTSTLQGNLQLNGGMFYPGGNGTIGNFVVTNNYTQTGGSLVINVDATAGTNDQVQVGNQATLGGNLTVNSLTGRPAGPVTIMAYGGGHQGDFATKTFNGGVTYTTDTSDPRRYKLNPN